LQIFFLSGLFLIWVVAFLLVNLPISGWVTPTFPFTIDYQYKLIFFFASTALASASFLVEGIQLFRNPPNNSLKGQT
jgi:hypothetical protein